MFFIWQAMDMGVLQNRVVICAVPLLVLALSAFAFDGNPLLGLPKVSAVESEELVQLGRKIFFDSRLSSDKSVSCASCHRPEKAFTDNLPRSKGVGGLTALRNAPTLVNAAFSTSQFWDGRRHDLEGQALDPFITAEEHGLANMDALLGLLREDERYVDAFGRAFGIEAGEINTQHVGAALAAYQRRLIAGASEFDRFRFAGERNALSASARRGLVLFEGRAECVRCHTISKTHALFSDNQFHSLNLGAQSLAHQLPRLTKELLEKRSFQSDPSALLRENPEFAALGRFLVTLKPADIGAFRTPSLRNVALTAPYMHDGSIATLEEAVDYEIYYRGQRTGSPLILTPDEKQDLVAFLRALTSDARALDALSR